jgi:hypothetical protein
MTNTSANKTVFIERFNTTVNEFVTQLCILCPNVKEFQTFKTGMSVLLLCDTTYIQQFFNKHIASKYRQQILNKDESFFLNENYDIEDEQGYWKSFIETICGLWTGLSSENKDTVWQYFRVLLVLNDKYNEINT